jgi:hypothetical protein
MTHLHFNHWAILVVAVFQWFLGAAWFSPVLFLKPWQKALGLTAVSKNAKAGMFASLVASLLLSFVLAHMILWSGASDFAHGAFVGFICCLGFYVAPYYALSLFEETPFKVVAINTSYWLVGILISGGVLAAWR